MSLPATVEPAPFVFGWPELLLTAIAAAIVFGILLPRWWRQRRRPAPPAPGPSRPGR